MTDDEIDHLYQLQGRILACEQLNRALLQLFAVTLGSDDAGAMLDKMELRFMASLQNMAREEGKESDAIWGAMGESLRHTFGAAKRGLAKWGETSGA